jgi:signal transduction histidine kinase
MAATLLPLADNVPGLEIVMEMPSPFLLDDPERAHVLLRCTQEIITNAVRHAHAQRLRLCYHVDGGTVQLQARDDGRGSDPSPQVGNGLRGIRERLAAYGGKVDIITGAGSGFAVDIRLPLEEGVPLLAPLSAPTSTFAIGPAEAAAALK